MRLTAFQSDEGDCLLLETADAKHRILIDGGIDRAYSEHVAPAMGKLRKAGKKLDVVYVSHIDADHISGVLQMLDDEAAWRVHEHQLAHDNPDHPEPEVARPPEVGAIFHNSFHDLITRNRGDVEDMLAATATILSGSDDPWLNEVAQSRRELAASIPQAMKVSRRIKPGQLDIPLNPQFDGKLMLVKDDMVDIRVGTLRLKVIGPFPKDVTNLRHDWNDWLRNNQKVVKNIRAQAERDEESMSASAVDHAFGPLLRAADRLGEIELALAKELGKRNKVTAPNLASLMFLATVDGKALLLTGDGHADDILKGLERRNELDADGCLHVNVLKVQHHGSEHNMHQQFCDAVTADHYVFCGNGEYQNPDLDVLQLIYDRRIANDKKRFKFWFNSSSKATVSTEGRPHMKEVETLVAKLARTSNGRLTNKFITGSSIRVQ